MTGFVGVKLLLSEVFSKWKRKWKGSGKENKEIKRDRKEEKKKKRKNRGSPTPGHNGYGTGREDGRKGD